MSQGGQCLLVMRIKAAAAAVAAEKEKQEEEKEKESICIHLQLIAPDIIYSDQNEARSLSLSLSQLAIEELAK